MNDSADTDQQPSYDDSLDESAEAIPRDEAVAQQIEEIPAEEGAAVLENLTSAEAADVAEYLDPETAGRILAQMDPEAAAHVLDDMEAPEASMVLASMDPDDRVDVLEHVSETVHDAIVSELNAEDRADVQLLEQYAPDTAGGIMTTQVTSLLENLSVQDAINELRRLNEEYEQMFYVYVIDGRRHLIGVLSMRDLILSRPDRRLVQVMRTEVASVPTHLDQEHVAQKMRRSNYLAMPVVDDHNRLVGIITVDDIVDVIHEEATEDVQKMFGAGPEERIGSHWTYSFYKRIGWLEVNLVAAFVAAWVISWFVGTIRQMPLLAAYAAIVAAMGGNAGAQSLAVAIGGTALSEKGRKVLLRGLYREAIVGSLSGVAIGLSAAIPAAFGAFGADAAHGYHPVVLAGVIAVSLIIVHVLACLIGAVIPVTMRKLGLDPAQSTAIWATAVINCVSFLTTFGIAELCGRWLMNG